MKVICIDGVKPGDIGKDVFNTPATFNNDEAIFEGEKYSTRIIREFEDGVFYTLNERPAYCWYRATRFAICSDIDETELVNHKPQTIEQ